MTSSPATSHDTTKAAAEDVEPRDIRKTPSHPATSHNTTRDSIHDVASGDVPWHDESSGAILPTTSGPDDQRQYERHSVDDGTHCDVPRHEVRDSGDDVAHGDVPRQDERSITQELQRPARRKTPPMTSSPATPERLLSNLPSHERLH